MDQNMKWNTQWHLHPDGGRDQIIALLSKLADKHGYEWEIGQWKHKGFDEPAIVIKGDPLCHTAYDNCGAAIRNVLELLNADGWEIQISVCPGKPTGIALFKPGTMDGPDASCGNNCDIEGALWGCLYALAESP